MARVRLSLVVIGTILVSVVLPAAPALAATILVNTTADEFGTGPGCALREAIEAANQDAAFGGCSAGSGADTISVPAGTYTLTIPGDDDLNAMGDLDIDSPQPTTIVGASARRTIVNGNGLDRVFHLIAPGEATITDLAVTGGDDFEGSDFGGGGIYNNGVLTLARVAVVNNLARYGAGVATYTAGSPN